LRIIGLSILISIMLFISIGLHLNTSLMQPRY
jgi:hypothetical protein